MTTSMEQLFQITEFQDAIDYVADMIGGEFAQVVNLTNKIIETPNDYTGPQAAMAAKKLAAYRLKIGIMGSIYKIKTPETKKPTDRLTKDAILVMYDALVELINTLKLVARHDNDLAKG